MNIFPWFRRKSQAVFVLQQRDEEVPLSSEEANYLQIFDVTGNQARLRDALSSPVNLWRLRLGLGGVLTMILLLLFRAGALQVWQGSAYRALAEENRIHTQRLPSIRGHIFDRNGRLLAGNTPTFLLTVTFQSLPQDHEERERLVKKVAELSGLLPTDIDLALLSASKDPFQDIPVTHRLSYESAMRLMVMTQDLPGFHVMPSSRRTYPLGALSLSHLLGYTGNISREEYLARQSEGYLRTDDLGKIGLERELEDVLRGIPGKEKTEVDVKGEALSVLEKDPVVPGGNITLTIDADLTQVIEDAMRVQGQKSGTSRGAVVVLDVRTGAVRALVSLPPFDSNAFVDGIDPVLYHRLLDDPNLPLIHRAIAGEYPSGSVFKPVVAYAALAEGIISEQTTVMSRGGLSVGPWFFPDWKAGGHGLTDVKKAIADSVNTFFYMVGGGYESMAGLGVDRITSTARLFGFGQKTGISLTGEADGFLPSSAWKEEAKGERWYVGDTYHLAIGQGDLLVTPLQMAVATAMIANDGRRLTPNLIEGVDGYASSYAPPKQPEVDPTIHLDALRVVREGMRRTVTHGTARSLQDLPFAVAGKTGTAQTPKEGKTHAWFTGFAPSEDPQIAVVVLLEDAGEGSEFATPVARVIFEWWAKHEE